MKIRILSGVSGSGKSTWATSYLNRDVSFVRINRDDIRKTLYGSLVGYYDSWILRQRESFVNSIEESLIKTICNNGYNIIIDNTVLKPSYLKRYIDMIKNYSVSSLIDAELVLFTNIDLKTCVERVKQRDGLANPESYIKAQLESLIENKQVLVNMFLEQFPLGVITYV